MRRCPRARMEASAATWLLLLLSALATDAAPAAVAVIDMRVGVDGPTKLACLSAAGLDNRETAAAYTMSDDYDASWLSTLLPNATVQQTAPLDYLASALSRYGGILYSSTANNGFTAVEQLPSIVTLAGLLDAVPIDEQLYGLLPKTKLALDTRGMWGSAEEAVKYAAAAGLNRTSTLAMQDGKPLLTGGFLADWIVGRRLFAMYLQQGCIPFTADNALLNSIISQAPWPKPIRVYGYNSLDVVFGGDLFEAETDCINSMGQIASAGTNNLAFWSQVSPPAQPLVQPVSPPVVYNKSESFIALVYGDMDNIDFVRSFGSDHMRERVARCTAMRNAGESGGTCFPLTWTLSPNLIEFAPAIMHWYYDQSALTGGRDWFIMPPSGTLYSYPGEMPADVQASYVEQQNAQAAVMNTSGTIHWEWMFTWPEAWRNYFPRYVGATPAGSGTRAFFLNDVPWVVPIIDMTLEGITFRWVGKPDSPDSVVGFKPALNWQEGSPGGGNPGNATVIAGLLSALPRGTVTYAYVIQNTNLTSVFEMVDQLEPHVRLVGYEQLVDVARQAALAEQ
eukprot:TRINITY_DN5688_c0_g1_i1.p1 TRINITY_DN5688_c0_g1~~TRINITY_DN5688_c0_g1_i1.p1  ORF type:complete len:564 (+),score=183.55 TRINITY_DN5688_c0_g1_i1:211-1902(+)